MPSWLTRFRNAVQNRNARSPRAFVNAIEVAEQSDQDWIRIVPVGSFPNHHNGAHDVTTEHIQEMAENFNNSGTDLLYDIDHESLFLNTRAAGWSADVEARDDGLYARYPSFTNFAASAVENREYRYFSPVYFLNARDKAGDRIGAVIDSVALTNRPYMDTEIDHIANSLPGYFTAPGTNPKTFINMTDLGNTISRLAEENEVSVAEIAESADRSESTIRGIMAGDIERPPQEVLSGIADALGVSVQTLQDELPNENSRDMQLTNEAITNLGLDPETATDAQINEAIMNSTGAGGGSPDAGSNDELEAKLNAIEQQLADIAKTNKSTREELQAEKVDALINSAIKNGKIAPRDKAAYERFANADFEAAKKQLDEIEEDSALPGKTNTKGAGNAAAFTNVHPQVQADLGISNN